jgi:hypothetical protein
MLIVPRDCDPRRVTNRNRGRRGKKIGSGQALTDVASDVCRTIFTRECF